MSLAYWQLALDGRAPPPVIDHPECGYYRSPRRGAAPLPLVIWLDDFGEIMGRLGDQDLTRDRLNEVWSFCAAHPVTEEAYRAVAHRGEPWPDMDATVSEQLAGIGHNDAPLDPLEALRKEIDIAAGGADKYETIADDETMARAQTLRAQLLTLHGQADEECEAEYRPHKAKADGVKSKWKPLLDSATAAANRVKKAMDAYGTRKLEAAEAQRKAIEAERAKAAETGTPAPPPPPIVAAAPAKVKGATGRAASGKPTKIVKSITDIDAAFAYCKEQPEVRDAIMQAAQRLVTAGHVVPGTEVKEEMRYK